MSYLLFPRMVRGYMQGFTPATPPPVVTKSLAQTDIRLPSSWGTITSVNIGAEDADRLILVSAITVATTADYDLTASAGSVTKIDTATHSSNAGRATWWSISGVTTGTTIDLTKSGTAASAPHICVFRSIGYEPEGSSPVFVDSEAGLDTLQASLTPTIDAGGAIVAHAGRYTAITGSGFTMSGSGVTAGSASSNRSWGWFEDTAGGSRVVTASAAAAVGRKCLSLLRLQEIP